jgi:hypothetical protein
VLAVWRKVLVLRSGLRSALLEEIGDGRREPASGEAALAFGDRHRSPLQVVQSGSVPDFTGTSARSALMAETSKLSPPLASTARARDRTASGSPIAVT